MSDQLITIIRTQYNHALFIKKELSLQNMEAYLKMPEVSNEDSEDHIEIQIRSGKAEDAIHTLLSLYKKLGKNPLTEIDFNSIELPKVILVPVDFSTGSEMAGKYAIDLAKMTGCEIKFHHVFFVPQLEDSRASATAAYENYKDAVQNEEEHKAKNSMAEFSDKMIYFAELDGISKTRLHFSYSGGKVSEQIIRLAEINASLVVVGPKKGSSVDDERGVIRSIIHELDLPAITIPGGDENNPPKLDKALYISEEKEKAQEHLDLIGDLFGKSLDLRVVNIDDASIEAATLEKLGAKMVSTDITNDIGKYMKEEGISLVIVDKPKGGIIGSVFGRDFSDTMSKQKEAPVLFLD